MQENISNLNKLPFEILSMIFQNLTQPSDYANLALTCKQFYLIIHSNVNVEYIISKFPNLFCQLETSIFLSNKNISKLSGLGLYKTRIKTLNTKKQYYQKRLHDSKAKSEELYEEIHTFSRLGILYYDNETDQNRHRVTRMNIEAQKMGAVSKMCCFCLCLAAGILGLSIGILIHNKDSLTSVVISSIVALLASICLCYSILFTLPIPVLCYGLMDRGMRTGVERLKSLFFEANIDRVDHALSEYVDYRSAPSYGSMHV